MIVEVNGLKMSLIENYLKNSNINTEEIYVYDPSFLTYYENFVF